MQAKAKMKTLLKSGNIQKLLVFVHILFDLSLNSVQPAPKSNLIIYWPDCYPFPCTNRFLISDDHVAHFFYPPPFFFAQPYPHPEKRPRKSLDSDIISSIMYKLIFSCYWIPLYHALLPWTASSNAVIWWRHFSLPLAAHRI